MSKQFVPCRLGSVFVGTLVLAWLAGLSTRADFPATLLSQGPVGYWRLNETVQPPPPSPAVNRGSLGSTVDGQYQLGAKRGEPGALAGTNSTSTRFFNPNFDPGFGASRVTVPYNAALNPSGPFSVEFWAKPTTLVTDVFCTVASINSDPAVASPTNASPRMGWLFYQNGSTNSTSNQWQFRVGNAGGYIDSDSIKGGAVNTGAWHHVVGTFNGSTAALYVNGLQVASSAVAGYKPNTARSLRIGTTTFDGILGPTGSFAGNRGFDGWIEEVAVYGTALNATDIAAHYNIAKTNGGAYPGAVLANRPLGYWRLSEPANPPAVNIGTLSTNANGQYIYGAHPAQAGPQPPDYSGFETGNRSTAFAGTNGYVDLPPLDLNTNTVTITAWILARSTQTNNAGIVFSRSGTTVAGLKFDINDPNGLSYNWNDDNATYNFKSGLTVPIFQWSFVALIVQPEQAVLCLQDGTQFSTATNFTTHPDLAFDGDILIGRDIEDPSLTFNGEIDEVAIFNRALSVGDVYTQYASAVGGLKPSFFADLQAPAQTVYEGDTLTLTVDAGGTPPLTYQWRKEGTPIAGATASSFSKPNATGADSGSYDVVISNAQGSITSQKAAVAVQPLTQPVISQHPQSRTVYQGGLLQLVTQASGGGLAYQWKRNGANIPGATNATYTVDTASGTNAGTYLVTVSNLVGTQQSTAATITVIVPPPGSYEDVISKDGPESWWRLDEATGSTGLTDAMGRHDGVYKGGVTLGGAGVLVGDTNTAAVFDGATGYAEVAFSKALNTPQFTIECWAKANPILAAMSPVASFTQPPGRGYLLQKSNDGVWYYMFGDGSSSAVFYMPGSDAIYNQWVHLAITYDGTNYIGYLNGRRDNFEFPDYVPNNVAPFRIGFDQPGDGWNGYWNGAIDEVAYYSKALTPQQVQAHYAAALYGPASKPVFAEPLKSVNSSPDSFFVFLPKVSGTPPVQFQWTKNGVPIPNSTNYYLFFNSLTLPDTGVYELTASNAFGTATSGPATIAVLPPPAFANLTNGLVLHLKFDGNFLDSTSHTNHAQPVGAPSFVPGVIGPRAVHYSTIVDDTDPQNIVVTQADYLNLGKPADLNFSSNVNFSVSYWVRFSDAPGDLPFLCNAVNAYTNPGFTFAPSYKLGGWSWCLGDVINPEFIGIYGPDGSINDGSWHHVVHTFDRSGSAFTYQDGALFDSRSIVPLVDVDTGENVTIGQDPTGAYPEAGEVDIDDLGIWRRVLTPFEAYSIYSAGQNGTSFDTYGPVSLAATSDAGTTQLVWHAGTLLQADDLRGPWSPVPGATPPYFKVTPGSAHKFYRVQL